MSEDNDRVPIVEITVEEPQEEEVKIQNVRRGDDEPEEDHSKEFVGDESSEEERENGLSGEDFVFLIGLGLFILYLAIVHPYTPRISHSNLVFWMSASMLFLSMVPDYLNEEAANGWLKEYKGTELEGFYRRIYSVARRGDRYFSSDKFFVVGLLLTLLAIGALFWTGEIPEVFFGVSYGVFMRAILV